MTYVYPAVLTPEGSAFNVSFPDLPCCNTFGIGIDDALKMADDALNEYLTVCEERGENIAPASDANAVHASDGCIVTLIRADTMEYRRTHSTKAVKKTLTIPAWLNSAAEVKGLNFSKVLSDALIAELGI